MKEIILNASSLQIEVNDMVEVNCLDRWQMYRRLQELKIPCCCATNQPLRVRVSDVRAAIQLWSVSRQFTHSRQDLVLWLEQCWQHN